MRGTTCIEGEGPPLIIPVRGANGGFYTAGERFFPQLGGDNRTRQPRACTNRPFSVISFCTELPVNASLL